MATNSSHLINTLKVVLVGDARVGKTWLLSRARELYATLCDGYSLLKKPFDPSVVYCETAFETCFTNVDTEDLGNYQTNIWDTGGSGFFNFVRPLAYICADVFMLCFDLSNRESFNNVTERWLPELRKHEPKTPVLIVGTKYDLRDDIESNDLISVCEAENAAEKVGCLYMETSAQTGHLVAEAFQTAVQLGHAKRKAGGAEQSQRPQKVKTGFNPTWIPPMKSPPAIKIEPSSYVSDLKKVLEDNSNADILFKFEDGSQSISAHTIMLWMTPSIFKDLLQDKSGSNYEQFKGVFDITNISDSNIDLKTHPDTRIVIVLKKWISRETFVTILEFLYTGEAGISKDTEQIKLKELLTASEKLGVQSLVDICNYFLQLAEPKKGNKNQEKSSIPNHMEKKILRPSPPLRSVQNMFLHKGETFCDVTFLVDGTLVYAHKAILVARSSVLAALLCGNFREGHSSQVQLHGIDCQSFLAVLEYLYTDKCPSLEKIPPENVLILADRLCLSRLVQICEYFMHRNLQQIVTASSILVEQFIDALNFSKMFNATQLTRWCLHFIALNYTSFHSNRQELDSLVKEDKLFLEVHCWPPKEYLQALDEYKLGAKGITAVAKRLRRRKRTCLPRTKCRIM